jgi:hypothetical protein
VKGGAFIFPSTSSLRIVISFQLFNKTNFLVTFKTNNYQIDNDEENFINVEKIKINTTRGIFALSFLLKDISCGFNLN